MERMRAAADAAPAFHSTIAAPRGWPRARRPFIAAWFSNDARVSIAASYGPPRPARKIGLKSNRAILGPSAAREIYAGR